MIRRNVEQAVSLFIRAARNRLTACFTFYDLANCKTRRHFRKEKEFS